MGAVFQVRVAQHRGGQLTQLGGVGDVARLDGGLAGDAVQGLVPEALGAVQAAVLDMSGDFGEGGRRVGLPDVRGDLPQQQVALAQVVEIVAQAQQQLPVLQQHRGLLPVKAAGLGLQQGLSQNPGALGQQPLKVDALVGGVLVDEDQLLVLLHQNVGAEELPDVAEIRSLLHPRQGQRGVGGRICHKRRDGEPVPYGP